MTRRWRRCRQPVSPGTCTVLTMETIHQTWIETATLFEQRALSKEAYENLNEDEYVLHPGPAALSGSPMRACAMSRYSTGS